MAFSFFGMSKGEENEEQKNAERVQDYISRFKIKSRDISAPRQKKSDGSAEFGWGENNWLKQATLTTDDRKIRNREYREMCKVPELNQGLHIYADNASQYNVQNNVLEIQSENGNITDILSELFFENLDINSNLWQYVKNMCKFGDEFLEVAVDNKKSPRHIVGLERIRKPERITREEKKGVLQRYIWESTDETNSPDYKKKIFMPWQMIHMKIDDDDYDPYGKSILESGRKVWKRLSLMEDAMLVYRISRAPERRVFYIDVGTLNTKEANQYIEQLKRKFRKKSFIDPTTGQINEKANPLAVDEDFYIPVRQESQGTRIETLPPGQNLGEIDDVKYFKDQILKSMGIPPGFLGGPETQGAYDPKSFLSQQDIQFARTIERIQRLVLRALEKIAILELIFSREIEEDEITNFQLKLTPPSNVDQLMEIEIKNQQFALIGTMKSIEGFLPDEWIYKNILGMNDKEINNIKLQIQMQLQMQAQMQAMTGGEAGGGGMDMSGFSGGNVAGGPAPAEAGGPAEPGGLEGVGTEAGAGPEGPTGPESLEVASNQFVEFDGGKWMMENLKDVQNLLKYMKLYEKVHKDNSVKKKREHNSATRMALEGEFRGILTPKKCSKNNHIQLMIESRFKNIKKHLNESKKKKSS